MEEAIAETMGRQESQFTFWLNFLSLITAAAPMFGLLGTVSGMIGAFDKIGMGGMGKPELLAANIGEAMITTAAGLLVAIPAMFAYFLLRNFLNKLLVEAEDHLTTVVEDLSAPWKKRRSNAEARRPIMKRKSREQPEAGIDMTPMIDMVFLLLVFFMCAATCPRWSSRRRSICPSRPRRRFRRTCAIAVR
jgi:hypothetical protein